MTYQQIKVLSYLAQGYGNEGFGSNLGISNRTVECHLQEIYNRLETDRKPDMNPRVHAALWFARQATLSPGDGTGTGTNSIRAGPPQAR